MPDADDSQVQIARLDGRLQGLERGLERQEQACEARSRTHVDRELYASEVGAIRQALADGRAEFASLRAAISKERADREESERRAEERRVRDRRYWLAGVAIPTIGLAMALVGALT